MANLQSIFVKVGSNKLVLGFAAILTVAIITASSAVSAAPDYFDVAKPSSTSQCYGSTTTYRWEWKWQRHEHRHFSYWTGGFVRVAHETPNWEKLGFDSQGQCLRYVSTPQPTSREDCREHYWALGFNNRGQCIRYFRLHGNTGYNG